MAKESIEKIAKLNPELAIPGHGQPMEGDSLKKHLEYLINNFDEISKPKKGRFVDDK